jgi:hypothetical protein
MDGRRFPQTPHLTGLSHINEPELDMLRQRGAEEIGVMGRLQRIIRKLVSDSRQTVAPMRSIAREMEESWPSGEW